MTDEKNLGYNRYLSIKSNYEKQTFYPDQARKYRTEQPHGDGTHDPQSCNTRQCPGRNDG